MAKRKVGFSDQDEVRMYNPEKKAHSENTPEEAMEVDQVPDAPPGTTARIRSANGEAHTLESDDEEEDIQTPTAYKMTDEDLHEDIDPEADEGDVAMTGFNLKDELEDGHFDETGNFVFKRDDDHAGDVWLEGAAKYDPKRKVEFVGKHKTQQQEDEASKVPEERFELLEEMVVLLKPQESVAQALKRFGGGQAVRRKASSRAQADAQPKDRASINRLTQLANALLADGMFDIYDHTYEKINYEIKNKNVVKFEYKWTQDEDAEVFGPYTAQQMLEWQQQGFFKNGIYARNTNKGALAPFYPSERIDFDLFT